MDNPTQPKLSGRLLSLDAYRGLVMLLMMAGVLNFSSVAAALPKSGFWKFLAHQETHSLWAGCSVEDLIQPSFSFIVGVALPFSIAARIARGQSRTRLSLHAFWRALLLILLGFLLESTDSDRTNWNLTNTLVQIGLGYGFLFLLAFRPQRDQWIAFAALLFGYWALFALWPLPGAQFNWHAAGVTPDWSHNFAGFAAHWNKNTNPAWAFDVWFRNLFPRAHPNNSYGYTTLNFVPTLATMLLGLLAGGVLRSNRAPWAKVRWLAIAGVIALVVGELIGWSGLCPVVKTIWTPSWALYSGGWCLLLLAAAYAVIDLRGWKGWAFPLVVIGMNSIAAYSMAEAGEGFVARNLQTHLGAGIFQAFGAAYETLLRGAAVLLVFWLILFWMYRKKIFLRI